MCKIHHAAYDADIFGITPNYRITVRPDVMEEIDGPTLRYTLQAIDGSTMALPSRRAARPVPELLDLRWQQFLAASWAARPCPDATPRDIRVDHTGDG